MRFKTFSMALIGVGALGLSSVALAQMSGSGGNCEGPGVYVGLQAGYGTVDYGSDIRNLFNRLPGHSVNEDGLAGRGYVGYQFNPFLGVETGYTIFSDNEYKAFGGNLKITAKTEQWDILGKAGMPFGNSGFRGDIKAGAVYVMTDVDVKTGGLLFSKVDSQKKWEPAAGASLTYGVTPNLSFDVSYLHTFGSDSKRDITPESTDLVTAGIKYRFA